MSKSDNYSIILAEELKAQRQQILEALDTLKDVPKKLDAPQGDITGLKSDMHIVKVAIKDLSGILKNHEKRIAVLETT